MYSGFISKAILKFLTLIIFASTSFGLIYNVYRAFKQPHLKINQRI